MLSEADFARLNGPEAGDVSVWARFAQPSRLVWAADAAARDAAVAAVARAAPTLLGYALPMTESDDPLDAWRSGFALTYASELRAERAGRPDRSSTPMPSATGASARRRCRWRNRVRRRERALAAVPAARARC